MHLAVAHTTGSPRLVAAMEHILDASARIFHLGITHFAHEGMRAEHEDLLDAIARHDPRDQSICRREAQGTSEQVMSLLLKEGDRAHIVGSIPEQD